MSSNLEGYTAAEKQAIKDNKSSSIRKPTGYPSRAVRCCNLRKKQVSGAVGGGTENHRSLSAGNREAVNWSYESEERLNEAVELLKVFDDMMQRDFIFKVGYIHHCSYCQEESRSKNIKHTQTCRANNVRQFLAKIDQDTTRNAAE
jgi:hypothetical protein